MDKPVLLVVDDVAINRSIIRDMLSDEYAVLEAANGAEALDILARRTVDIVVTDIFMEPVDGYELIRTIRDMPALKYIPVIAVTESDQASRRNALRAGADDLIYHPYIGRILNNRIRGLLYDGFDMVRYRSAYENNPIPFLLYRVIDRPDTPSYKIMYLNKAARGLFDPPVAEGLMRTDELPGHRDFVLNAVRTGDPQHGLVYSDSICRWVDLTVYPDGNGLVAAMVHDVTEPIEQRTHDANIAALEARRTRDELNEILGNIPAGVVLFTLNEGSVTISAANKAICQLMNLDETKVIGAVQKDIVALIHPDDVTVLLDEIGRLCVPDSLVQTEFRFLNRDDGTYRWFSVQARSRLQPNGSMVVFSSYIDVSAEKQLDEAQIELAAAKRANAAKTDFLSRLSHDMRTPMNGILGLVELMKDRDDIEEIHADLNQVALSGHYLLNLMNDTLDLNKIDSGHLELHEVPINSVDLMRNVLATAQLMASNKGVQLKVVLPPIPTNEWKPIVTDAARLEQILINVLSNAVKYTPEDGIVQIEMQTVSVTDTEVVDRYVVTDTGIGMSPEFLKHAFDPFMQEGRDPMATMNGTGLGLTIVKQLVDMMGGDIQIESAVGKGTKVTLTMHYKVFDGVLEAPQDVDPARAITGMRVLLCEDHPLNAAIATKLLERVGVKTDLASDGSLGLGMFTAAEDGYYDAILMDLRMPVMDGIETTRRIRHLGKRDAATVPIIAMTANAFSEDVEMCREAGMTAYLTKPVDPAVLYRTIAECTR